MILKYVLRSFLKRPFLFLIKIIGLSLSLTCILFIALFLKNELSYDEFHAKHNQIYRITFTDPGFLGGKHFARIYRPGYIPDMKDNLPQIENFVRLEPIRGDIKHHEQYINVKEAFRCDSTFFQIFDAELLAGKPDNVLNDPNTMVVSEGFAKRIFGSDNPIGQVLTLPSGQFYGEDTDFLIRGIMRDFPSNSHFHPDFLVTFPNNTEFSWGWTYLLLKAGADTEALKSGIADYLIQSFTDNPEEFKTKIFLQKISDIHLNSDKFREIEANGNMNVIYSLGLAGIILLIIALVNYSGLSNGMRSFTEKYIFISRINGSSRSLWIKYLFIENVWLMLVVLVITIILSVFINQEIFTSFSLHLFRGNFTFVIFALLFFMLFVLLISILPVLGQFGTGAKCAIEDQPGKTKRKGMSIALILLQYTISIALLAAVFVIHRQTKFALESSMGAANENTLICFEGVHQNVQRNFELFKSELLKYDFIENVSAMLEPPGGEANDKFRFEMEGHVPDEENPGNDFIGIFPCDYSFFNTFNLPILAGTDFSDNNEDPEGYGEFIVNESAVKKFGYSDPQDIIGKNFRLIQNYVEIPSGTITGVVKDFHLSKINNPIEPLVFFKRKDIWLLNFIISFRTDAKNEAIAAIETTWREHFPDYPFQFSYLDSMNKKVYRSELLQLKLLYIFTILSLFICSMGLLGLSLLVCQRRTKEIGVRKVNGARSGEILRMLNWDMIKWILLSFFAAAPISYYGMSKWLENYAYKTELSWWIFSLAGFIVVFISLLTISIVSLRVANRNPVEALRYE